MFRLVIRELREWVNWTRRWRDCSRAFIWSWFREVILYWLSLMWFGRIRMVEMQRWKRSWSSEIIPTTAT